MMGKVHWLVGQITTTKTIGLIHFGPYPLSFHFLVDYSCINYDKDVQGYIAYNDHYLNYVVDNHDKGITGI